VIRLSIRLRLLLVVVLLLGAAALRLWQLTTLPPGLSSGEIVDVRIVETAREGSIEVFYDLGSEGREGLYHVLVALVTSLIGDGMFGYRLFSVWMGLLALALVYAVGARLFGPVAGLGALALLAFSLWPVLLSRQITRETLLPLLVTAVLLYLTMALPVYRRKRRRGDHTTGAAALGLTLGLGLYIHPTGLLIAIFSMVFIVYMILVVREMSRRRLSYISFTLLMTIIISMPYLISSLRRPQLAGLERLTGESGTHYLQSIVNGLGGIVTSGDPSPLHNLPERPLFDPISVGFIVVGLAAAVIHWRQPRYALLLTATVILSPVFLLAASAPNLIHYAVALPLLALLFGIGLRAVWTRLPDYGQPLAAIGLVALLVFNISWTGRDLFGEWAGLPEVRAAFNARLGELATYIDRTAGDIPTVVCGWRIDQSPFSPSLTDAQLISLMLNREHRNLRYVDCYNALIMTQGGAAQQVILPNPVVMQTGHPHVRAWLEQGTRLQHERIPPEALVLALDVEGPLADAVGQLTLTRPVSYAPEAGGTRDELVHTPVQFGGNLTFLGYIPEQTPAYRPGSIVTIITYWRIDGMVPPDLRLFTHILADPGARPPANTDTINVDPRRLKNRDVVIQVTYVPLPQSLPDGTYTISVGAYQDTSEQRLDVLADGAARGTRLFLYDITVRAE
jgi:4-amino-4-deoxy-L-arabinose transferase-like glycosyltransferase